MHKKLIWRCISHTFCHSARRQRFSIPDLKGSFADIQRSFVKRSPSNPQKSPSNLQKSPDFASCLARRIYRFTGHKAKEKKFKLEDHGHGTSLQLERYFMAIIWKHVQVNIFAKIMFRSHLQVWMASVWKHVQISNHLKTCSVFNSFENMFNFPNLKRNTSNRRAN